MEVGNGLPFPVAWGVERELGDLLGSFWEEERNFIQPTEFLIYKEGSILSSTYSSSPVGRMDPEETLQVINFIAARDKKNKK